ncbi:MAG: ATP-binding cassette domain-containing protein, partial [Alphaproteobacteria bacterium]|nr:ATP-binding cassette domain-containing protein [Alphaproteobacteria bacterium]
MLTLRGVETCYGSSQILFGIDLDIGTGQVATLLGRNGMGKTTTVRSILGLTPPRRGEITLEGRSLAGLPPYRIAQAGIGLVP